VNAPAKIDTNEQIVHDGRLARALAHFAALRLEEAAGYCSHCEGRGTVPPAGNHPYFDREEVHCIECDGTGEA
jgi:hypothetical protein